MPLPGMMWRHVIISTRRSWLHGDGRGFRSREHRIHSSGDYKNPPPPGEHRRLHQFHQRRAKGVALKIPKHLRRELGRILLGAVEKSGCRVLVIAVTAKHAHLLAELPKDRAVVKRIVGKWKCARSKALRSEISGSLWGEGGKYKPVRTRPHLVRAYKYVRDEQGPGARVWTFRSSHLTPKRLVRPARATAKPGAQRSGAPDRDEEARRRPGTEI